MAATKHVDLDTTLAIFGLANGKESEENADAEEQDSESEEREETFEEDSEGEEQEDNDEYEEDTEEYSEAPPKDKLEKLLKRLEAAEEGMRSFQSKADSEAYLRQQLQQKLENLESKKSKESTKEPDINVDDDDFITGKQLKELWKAKAEDTSESTNEEYTKLVNELQQRQAIQTNYLSKHKDWDKVQDFLKKNNLAADPELKEVVTDNVGLFFAVKNKILEQELKYLKSKNPKEKLPPMSKKNRAGRATTKQSGNASNTQQQFERFFGRRGFG